MDKLNEKYKDILRSGKELFWRYGMKKVSVEEICSQGGTSRVTFYKYFKNKEDLAYAILKEIMDNSLKEYVRIMESDISFENKIKKVINLKMRSAGNLSYEFLNDLNSSDYPRVVGLVDQTRLKTMKMLEGHFREAQRTGHIRNDVKMEFIIYFINKIQELVYDPVLEAMYSDTGSLITELVRFLFYGIMPEKYEDN